MTTRRDLILSAIGMTLMGRAAMAAGPLVVVYKSPTCGCCSAWGEHMARAGFAVDAIDVGQDALWSLKARSGITPELVSCHTAFVEGYVVEGHVPATDVLRLLAERPNAVGLTVPGMPIGSPGMEMGNEKETYETLLVLQDAAPRVFQRHG